MSSAKVEASPVRAPKSVIEYKDVANTDLDAVRLTTVKVIAVIQDFHLNESMSGTSHFLKRVKPIIIHEYMGISLNSTMAVPGLNQNKRLNLKMPNWVGSGFDFGQKSIFVFLHTIQCQLYLLRDYWTMAPHESINQYGWLL